MSILEQRIVVFIAIVTLASCATGVPPSEDRPTDDAGTSGGSGGSPPSAGVGGTGGTSGSGAIGGSGGSAGSGGSSPTSGGTGGFSDDGGLDAAAGIGGTGGTAGTAGTGGAGGSGGRSGISDGGGDIRNCNPGKTNDCPTPISSCESTSGCVDIVVCIMQNGCSRTPCSACTALIQSQSEPARTAAENLFACLGGCS
jgi:hypothetical protein